MKIKTTKLIIATMVAYFLFLGVLPVHAQDGGDEEEIEFRIDDDAPMEPGNSKTPVLDQFEK